jgi:Phage terminase large subunit
MSAALKEVVPVQTPVTRKIKFPAVFRHLFEPHLYKIYYGGRGSGKTWNFACALVWLAARVRLGILCAREYQNSIDDSVYATICEVIQVHGYAHLFVVTNKSIRCTTTGSFFLFKGLHHDILGIKSLFGINICWVEEASKVTKRSWDTLIPTLRPKPDVNNPGAVEDAVEIWVSFNPEDEDDETYKRFVRYPPKGAIVMKVNYTENPYFPKKLDRDRLDLYDRIDNALDEHDRLIAQADYEHIWEGFPRKNALGGFFIKSDLLIRGKPIPKIHRRFDGVFAVLDTAVKTGMEHDGLAVAYWAISDKVPFMDGEENAPIVGRHNAVLLDWDYTQIQGALLEKYMPTVFARLEELTKENECLYSSFGAFVEDKVSGSILIQQGEQYGWNIHPIDTKLTAMGKSERALDISGFVQAGRVKVTQHAYEKKLLFKGNYKNHMMQQVLDFRIGRELDDAGHLVKLTEDDCLDAFCYGVALSLGNHEGF